ncbi:MAG: amidohydrolase family protein [Tepidisphaera sp.]|nr:amidohydrolase family protein [Tepidisphaera sp.]
MTRRTNEAEAVSTPEIIVHRAKIATMDRSAPAASALAIAGGRFVAVGDEASVLAMQGPGTRLIDAGGRRVIPGLYDSHLHIIRGGLNYNLELRWDGVPSLADAMRMLREQASRTPQGQWVRVVGGFAELQFAERRLPTLDELNEAAPDTPVFILHLYDRVLLNRAALRAVGYTKDTPDPPGGLIERDARGNPTGLLVANPNAWILYKTLSLGPRLPLEHQVNSTRHFMRELNRLGVTSVCDAGGGFQNYPDDYVVIQELQRLGELTVRIAYNLFTQRPKQEREDFANWATNNRMYQGDEFLRLNGAGEMLVYSAADFEDFKVDLPDMPPNMEADLEGVVGLLARNRWAFRLHATYDQTISRALDVFERVDREAPLRDLRWFFDHCETISDRNIERVKALGGGIAVQHRMAFQGEYFIDRYGRQAAERTPPVKRMLEMGVPVGAGTDATRVASYNPWTSLSWLVTGKTVGGTSLYPERNLLAREEALRLYTSGSAWFSREESVKGRIAQGCMADLAILSEDYFEVPEERIRGIESLLTVVGGKAVHGAGVFAPLAPPPVPVLPEWSPVGRFGGHWRTAAGAAVAPLPVCCPHGLLGAPLGRDGLSGGAGCSCWAF